MNFMLKQGWQCQFIEVDFIKTPLPQKLIFSSPDKILQLVLERAGALKDLAARQAGGQGIEICRGGVYLMLTPEQYTKPKTRKQP
jgi:hypothetical protein